MPSGDLGLGQQRPHRAEGEWGCWGKLGSQNPCGAGGVVLCPHKQEPLLCVAGPLCKYKHARRVMCANYLVGFCPEGPKCKFMQYVRGSLGGGLSTQPAWDSPLSEAAEVDMALAVSGSRTRAL